MTVRSRVVAVKGMRIGETSGYGAGTPVMHPTTVAVVPAGYADGLDVRMAGRGAAIVRGQKVPVVGAVSMDSMTINVTGVDVSPGDEVVLIGTQNGTRIGVDEVAAALGTVPHEILCRTGSRISRSYDRPSESVSALPQRAGAV